MNESVTRTSALPSRVGRPATLKGMVMALVPLLFLPIGADGQSQLASEGLGLVMEPLDAHARGVGGVGVGLPGWYLQVTDPSASAGLVVPAITGSLQPSAATLTDGREVGHTRFPSIGASYPYGANVFSVHFGGFADQEFRLEDDIVLNLAGEPVEAVDRFESTGSLGQVRVGWSRRVLESVALGFNVGSYVGTVDRIFSRFLDPEAVGPDVEPFITTGRWRASGPIVGGGVAWDPSELIRLSASATWSGDLKLRPSAGGVTEVGRYPIPFEVRAGGTVALLPGLALSASLSHADWSETGDALREDESRGAAWSYGAGVEWSRPTILGRAMPIRLGVRQRDLPFHFDGEPATENMLSAGLGYNLTDPEAFPSARVDFSFERGERSAGPALEEEFWRSTVTVRLTGG